MSIKMRVLDTICKKKPLSICTGYERCDDCYNAFVEANNHNIDMFYKGIDMFKCTCCLQPTTYEESYSNKGENLICSTCVFKYYNPRTVMRDYCEVEL